MECVELVDALKRAKNEKGYTLHELSQKLDVQMTTLARWLKTKRMNRLYAQMLAGKIKDL